MAYPQLKRRNHFINREFQTKFMLKFCLLILAGGVLSVLLTMWSSQGTLTSSYDGTHLAIEKTSLAILPSVIMTTIVTTCIISIIAVVVMLFVSHRIAGPMYRFESDVEAIAKGDLSKKIRIREGDQFESLVGNLNTMVTNLNSKVTETSGDLDKLHDSAVEQNLPDSFIDEIEECRRKIGSHFKL